LGNAEVKDVTDGERILLELEVGESVVGEK
jgi:hypothetical protein